MIVPFLNCTFVRIWDKVYYHIPEHYSNIFQLTLTDLDFLSNFINLKRAFFTHSPILNTFKSKAFKMSFCSVNSFVVYLIYISQSEVDLHILIKSEVEF